MPESRALVVTTPTADGPIENGATLRAAEVIALLDSTGYDVVRTTPSAVHAVTGTFDVGVAVSYACAGAVRALRARARRVWLDATDSWLLVNASGLRNRHPSYLLRMLRDGTRLVSASSSRPDLLTYISRPDLAADHGTVPGRRRLVLPGRTPPVFGGPGQGPRAVLAGDWGYPPNRDGLDWFIQRVLPVAEARTATRDWHVAVYGSAAPAIGNARVRVLGYADDSASLYRDGDVHVAPVRFGGGVKRKVLLPLLSGLPVVTTPAGAHGLRQHALLDVHEHAAAFARAVAQRLDNPLPRTSAVPAADLLTDDDTEAVLEWLRA